MRVRCAEEEIALDAKCLAAKTVKYVSVAHVVRIDARAVDARANRRVSTVTVGTRVAQGIVREGSVVRQADNAKQIHAAM